MHPAFPSPKNVCGICGATSYRKVIERDASGVLRPTERLRCTGCEREFVDVLAWRKGIPWAPASSQAGT